ncbi:CTD small phosphatase-like protein 2-A isoform X3 [Vombatus ursinus]|uniref:CTD small phosphatase-like protein 2-A isoform X3 n=1 Tax=Vombatus ursinus TaxID=29139 RepID=UPI000FFD84A4|nr:CTD small phosphatase-like protein 2-A isoform X3 [Vombatus ursinus]
MILRSGKVTFMSPRPLGDLDVLEEDRWPCVSPCWPFQRTREASRQLERSQMCEADTQEASGEVHLPSVGQCQALSLAQESSSKRKWAKAFDEEAPQVPWSQPTTPNPYFSALPVEETFPCPLSSLTPCPLYRRRLWPRRLNIPPKTRSMPDSTLVLELDDTLVSCSLRAVPNAHFCFPVSFQGMYYKVQGRLRPHTREFLEILSQFFQGHYVKDLKVLGQDLARTVILTDSLKAFPYQVDNQLLIPRWQGDSEDQELSKLLPFLERLSHLDDVRPELWNLHPTLSTEK